MFLELHDPPAPTGSKSPEVAVSIGEMSAGVLKTRHVSASSYDSALDTSFYNCSKPESARDANIYEALSILSGKLQQSCFASWYTPLYYLYQTTGSRNSK